VCGSNAGSADDSIPLTFGPSAREGWLGAAVLSSMLSDAPVCPGSCAWGESFLVLVLRPLIDSGYASCVLPSAFPYCLLKDDYFDLTDRVLRPLLFPACSFCFRSLPSKAQQEEGLC